MNTDEIEYFPQEKSSKRTSDQLSKLKFSLDDISLADIEGIDLDIKELFDSFNLLLPTCINLKKWDKEIAKMTYRMAPMILIKRKKGYEVLGSGRAFQLAHELYEKSDKVPALVLNNFTHISLDTKLQIVASELFGLYSEYRTRPHFAENLKCIWEHLNKKGVCTIQGKTAKDFANGTGFSVKSVTGRQKVEHTSTS